MPMLPGPPRRRGFTLIELLVVIAIIAILAAILFPVFAQARDKARGAACLSNCKQIALAVTMYAQDYDELLVPGRVRNPNTAFDLLLNPYVKNQGVWTCPSAGAATTAPRSINMNKHVALDLAPGLPPAISMVELEFPSEMVVMSDGQAAAANNFSLAFTISLGIASEACTAAKNDAAGTPLANRFPSAQPYSRHSEGANYCYADGHAKWSRAVSNLIPNVRWFAARPALATLPANCQANWPNGLFRDPQGR